ncbi:MAG: hypothetical protein Q7S06_03640 [Nanoarchaeota archaeon]|nr:hypothetical protein [Nanoarchaeota archaeon]
MSNKHTTSELGKVAIDLINESLSQKKFIYVGNLHPTLSHTEDYILKVIPERGTLFVTGPFGEGERGFLADVPLEYLNEFREIK